jgi:uncharacterized membrane protein
MADPHTHTQPPRGAALLLGFALGGFFDGILLHQVLEWHHLLSRVDGVRDLRTQILADGLFHVLMWVLAAAALLRLRKAWGTLQAAGSGSVLTRFALYGFALWQAVDVVVFHWIAGIHNVRVDVPNPLAWDVGWLVVFGVPPLLLARWLDGRRGPGGAAVARSLALLAVVAGAWSAWPVQRLQDEAVVVFAPHVTPARAFDALSRLDGRVRWVDAGGGVWAVRWSQPPSTLDLLREGAVLVSGTPLAVGCVGWAKAGDV